MKGIDFPRTVRWGERTREPGPAFRPGTRVRSPHQPGFMGVEQVRQLHTALHDRTAAPPPKETLPNPETRRTQKPSLSKTSAFFVSLRFSGAVQLLCGVAGNGAVLTRRTHPLRLAETLFNQQRSCPNLSPAWPLQCRRISAQRADEGVPAPPDSPRVTGTSASP